MFKSIIKLLIIIGLLFTAGQSIQAMTVEDFIKEYQNKLPGDTEEFGKWLKLISTRIFLDWETRKSTFGCQIIIKSHSQIRNFPIVDKKNVKDNYQIYDSTYKDCETFMLKTNFINELKNQLFKPSDEFRGWLDGIFKEKGCDLIIKTYNEIKNQAGVPDNLNDYHGLYKQCKKKENN